MYPYLGELRLFAFNFAPHGWASCDGQILAISQNQALFAILGTTYGGNGQTTFALPDLRDRTPRHVGSGTWLGQSGGEAAHTLSVVEIPQHAHALQARSGTAVDSVPGGKAIAAGPREAFARRGGASTNMAAGRVVPTGGHQPHENRQPFACLQYAIAMQGVFPSQSGGGGGMDSPLPFIGEVRMFAGNFAPNGWAFCDGQLMSISQNTALFSLVGTYYGGNGMTTFALPDLRARIPMHRSQQLPIGAMSGQEQVTLIPQEIPSHTHALLASSATATDTQPGGNLPARTGGATYAPATAASGQPTSSTPAGGSQPHDNMAPSLPIRFIIALQGMFPSRP